MISDVIYEYENILLGKKKNFTTTYFELSAEQNEKTALLVFHHAIKHYLRWNQKQVEECLDWNVIRRMRLCTLMKYIRFPAESDREKDLYILYNKLYPRRSRAGLKEPTISVYKRVLSGERTKFPKGYFDGIEGMYRSLICFQYMITLLKPFNNVDEMYKFFASNRGTAALKKHKLSIVCNTIYETPIDYLHTALPSEHRNVFLFNMYKFNVMYKSFLAEKKLLAAQNQ